ncbi:MAG: carboxypeptidase regulatory-like domain-containing protein [Bryobacteraceae bacterium]|nr:carboxypeptidase regulatory-like domain-containing protein [Bryobacteraceae bacterium]
MWRLILPLLLTMSAGLAQAPIGTIAGTVTDDSGAVVAAVAVTVTNTESGLKRETLSNAEGQYSVPALPAGRYEVRAQNAGFRVTLRQATVVVGSTTTVDLALQVGAVTEVVNVDAATSQIAYDSHKIDGVIGRTQIESLPLNGRSFLQLAFLEPGVGVGTQSLAQYNAQFSVSVLGASSGKTALTVDGGNVRNALEGGSAQNFSQEVVEEFQISSANFDLSTGIAASGAINIVSRSGGNDFHGGGYFFYRDNHLSAYPALRRNPFAPDPFFARRQAGFLASGPIKKDKLFFFFNLENNNQDSVVTVQPDSPYFAGLAQNAVTPYDARQISAKFDYRINTNHNLFARYSHDGNHGFGPRSGAPLPSNWLVNRNWADQSIMGLTSTFRSTLVNDFRFAYQYWNNRNLHATEKECPGCLGIGLPEMSVVGTNVRFGNTLNAPQGRDIRRYNLVNNMTWQRGAHRMRFGGSFENSPFAGFWAFGDPAAGQVWGPDIMVANRIPLAAFGLPNQFSTNADVLKLPLLGFAMGIGDPSQPPPYNRDKAGNNRRYHFYWQDTYRVNKKLTLNYGLSWQYESTLVNGDLSKPALLAPIMESLEPTKPTYTNWSPSLGFAWNPFRNNKTVIRGGGGFYYDTTELSQRLGERAAIGPVGNGRQQIGGQSIPNPTAGIVNPIPGLLPNVNVGTPLDFRTLPTGFRLSDLLTILPRARATAEAAVANPNPNDLSVRNINLSKQGTDIYPYRYGPGYARHLTLGVQREVRKDLVVTADFVYRHGFREDLGALDYNRFFRLAGPVIPRCTGTQAADPRANCSTGSIGIRTSAGRSVYRALLVKVDKRFSKRFQFLASYSLAAAQGMNGVTNLDNWFENWGPMGGRHGLNVSGIVDLPYRVQLSFISSMGTRGPYRPQLGSVDLDGDGQDTAFLPGWNVPDRKPTKQRLESAVAAWNNNYPDLPNGQRPRTSRGQTIPRLVLPADYSFGDNFSSQDIRVTKSFVYRERYKLNVFMEGFNVFNVANLGGISNSLNNPAAFGIPTSRASQVFGSGGPRAFQLGSRFSF